MAEEVASPVAVVVTLSVAVAVVVTVAAAISDAQELAAKAITLGATSEPQASLEQSRIP